MRGRQTRSLFSLLLLCPVAACPDCEPVIADAAVSDAGSQPDTLAIDAPIVDAAVGDAAVGDTASVDQQPADSGNRPTALVRVKSVNGTDVTATALHLLPLDDVVLTAADSVPGSGRTITGYLWQIIQQPVGSTVVFSTPDAVETGFTFNSSTLTRAGLDVVGSYHAVLTVTDDQGTTSSNNARLILVVSPTAGLLVQLTWDHPSADLDLHLIRSGGAAFSSDDCHYLNCKTGMNLDWGGGDQDPLLWLDDIDGYGPELIWVLAPAATSYRVAVHYYSPFSTSIDATARVAIYADGELVAEASRLLTQCNALWEVGDLAWPALTFSSVDTVQQDTHGLCP